MEKYSEKDIDWLLNLCKDDRRPLQRRVQKNFNLTWKRLLLRVSLAVNALLGLVVLPFFLLIRFSVYLNLSHGWAAWPSLIGGIIATILLLTLYLFLISLKVKNRRLLLKTGGVVISTMVLGFCMFSIFYLSSLNAKSSDVRDVYHSMHPILRVAVSTVTLADKDLVITGIERIEGDYARMGLPVNRRSLHYRQETGYVHAVDIRTLDRGFIRNALLRGSLELMGFRTIRHVGTADHLHVELRHAHQ